MSSEHLIQVSCVNWFKREYPNYLIFSIPNGELRHKTVAIRLKAEGLLSGVPDLCIITDKKLLWIELKAEKGRLSTNQKEVQKKLQELNQEVYTCYSFDDFKNLLQKVTSD